MVSAGAGQTHAGSGGTRPADASLSPLGCRLRDWNVGAREGGPQSHGRGLVLDLDDTLFPREHFVQSGLMAVARHVQERHGIPAMEAFATMSAARRNGAAGRELQALCDAHALAKDVVPELVAVIRNHRPLLRLPKETVAVLTALRADGWRMVVLTNGLPQVQRAKVLGLGLAPLVDGVIYAEDVVPGGKPAAGAFKAALAKLSLPAGRCVCVGDDPVRDIAGARAMGLRTVWLVTGAAQDGSGAAITSLPTDACITALSQLPEVLSRSGEMVTTDAA